MGIQLSYGCFLGCSKKVVYRSFKILLIASTISLPIQQTAVSQTPPWIANPNAGDDIIGVNYNSDLGKNQIWSLNSVTDSKTLLQSFAFPSGWWAPGKSYVDERTGTLWMWDSGDSYTVYDVESDTITHGVGEDGALSGMQNLFLMPLPGGTSSLISQGEDGETHVGPNSFITREFGGKQEIYATNAAGGAIDLNVTNGSDLLVNGASVMGSIRGLTALSTAFSSVPNDSEESRYQCGVGFGGYDGKTAVASGCAMRLSNFTMGGERFDVSVNAAASYLPSGSDYLGNMPSTAIRAGVSIKFGSATPNTTAFRSSEGSRSAAYLRQLSAARREISDLQNKVADLEDLKAELVEVKLMMASFTNMQTTAMR